MEEIDGLWKRFSLKDQEDDKFDLSSMAQQDKPTLAAKFFTRRTINIEAVARTFKPLWQTKHNFSLQDVGDNMVLVEFEDRSDLERVLIGEPWSYDKYLNAFQRVGDGREVEDLLFHRVDFWVQIHNLPILCMKKSVVERLGRSIGEVVRTQVQDEDTGNGRYMRAGFRLNTNACQISCYWCGIPTHGERDCEEWLKTTEEEKDKDPEYGVWLRASQDRVLRRVQVTVEGRSRSTSKPMGGEQAVPPSPQAPTKPAVVHSPPTELDPTDMETTEYLGGINKATDFEAQNSATFEDQLRAIDMALNYTSVIPEKSRHNWSPLGEITNKVAASTHKPNVGTWKKMARAKGQGTHDTRKFSVAEKRACDEVGAAPPNPMSCLSWNCRGLGNPGTVQELANMVRVKDPSAIFVMETWSHEEYLEKVTIKSYSSSHIDAIIKEGSEDAWRLTGIYGALEAQRREETWALLRHLDSRFQLPWCCIGDFNEILKLEEMKGRFARPDRQMRGFRSALDDCGLVDLRYRGFPFTWCNNRDPPFTTWVRLDRAVANMEWLHRFPMAQVEHIDVSKSDHKCLWLSCLPPVITRSKRRPFRFEEIWMTDGGCEETITKAWEMSKPGTRMFKVWHKLKECKKQLGEWSRKSFGNIKKQIEILQQRIKQAESLAIQDRVHANINGRATQRRRRNSVSKLCDERGSWHESNEEIAELMIEYYTTLFTTSNPTHLAEATSEVQKVVTLEMNNNLTREFRAEEVEQAIQQMAPSKAPGPDGRLITDNVLVAFETLHHMHHNKIGREGAMAMKLDMSKAYDRVEWSYLEQIMKKMGFHQKWIGDCAKGIPLSPYLFLLVCRRLVEKFLIKAVAQAIPAYSMSCFRLPIKLCKELEAMIRRFWWSNNSDQQKVNWVSWRKLCEPKNMGGMGFRDLQKFNEALLAKQVWRLMHDTSSLFYRVFKAKFFPNCSILEADPKIRGSYAWQSIMKSRELLIKGGVWRVGDGRRIKIWKNRWLLEDNHRTIITHGPQLLQDCTVDQLIIKPKMEWDTTLIDKLFLPYDAEAIKSIPLSERAPPDRFYWPGTSHGLYTVRSGYQALLHNEKAATPWKLHHRCSSTNLESCVVTPDPQEMPTLFWSCPVLTPVWDKEPWIHSLRATPIMDFTDLFSKVLDLGTYQNTEAFSIISWSLWQRRNKQRLHQEVEAIDQVSTRARAYLDEFVSSIEPLQPAEPTSTLVIKWQPPSRHNFKINYDGAVFKETNEAGIGVVVRNKAGHVMASLFQKVRYPQSVESIEAWAAKRAVQFVSEIGLKEAEFEGDSKTIVAALNDPHHCPTHYGLLIADAKSLAHALDSYCFTHVKRQGNGLAHALARMAKHTDILEVWMEDVPPPLQQLYLSDFPIQ
uniref:CCHC-type domain-containing protein n=1 Tax=Fagus sylvatica TaxID=28930 RepID=A0A2N9EK22_FAGSY